MEMIKDVLLTYKDDDIWAIKLNGALARSGYRPLLVRTLPELVRDLRSDEASALVVAGLNTVIFSDQAEAKIHLESAADGLEKVVVVSGSATAAELGLEGRRNALVVTKNEVAPDEVIAQVLSFLSRRRVSA